MIILASGSPRRRDLLQHAGYTFERSTADIDESVLPGEPPVDYILRVSYEKAEAVRRQVPMGSIIITADTSVVDGDDILGKPQDETEAIAMLQRLRGRTHQVMTAFTVLDTATNTLKQSWVSTDVEMRPYSDAEIVDYVASGDPMDKAGAYAIQNPDFAPVARIAGCYANVVGLPLCRLVAVLKAFGQAPSHELACNFPTDCALSGQY